MRIEWNTNVTLWYIHCSVAKYVNHKRDLSLIHVHVYTMYLITEPATGLFIVVAILWTETFFHVRHPLC